MTRGTLSVLVLLGCSGGDPAPSDRTDTDQPADTDTDTDTDSDTDADTDTDAHTGHSATETETGDTGAPPFLACATVTGTAGVTFTRDEGATLTPTATRMNQTEYTPGLVVLPGNGRHLMAQHANELLESTDGGCTWTVVSPLDGSLYRLEAADADTVYAWADNTRSLGRIDAGAITRLGAPSEVVGLAVDPADPLHVRIGGWDGGVYESTDGGARFGEIGRLDTGLGFAVAYRVAFAPNDLDHVVAGTMANGAWLSRDGGDTWTAATGFGTGSSNVFNVVFSPVDPNVVWAQGIDLAEQDAGAANEGRHLWRSTDGGATFTRVVEQAPDLTLVNGTLMAPHPTDADVLYFVFGTYFQGYGTDLFRYRAGDPLPTKTHSAYDDVMAITFSPVDPTVMYLGLVEERIQ